ncbi:MAG: dienelactone hydrolase family protein [Longimicrobiales bacterium]|nr:dienelactone hydrolase family protein [Longimicrobiales bacterium]
MDRTLPRNRALPGLAALALALALALLPGAAAAQALPAENAAAVERLNTSPRHGEWVKVDAGSGDIVDAFVVYPERSDAAPVVVVIHEIGGLTDWVRSVADQLAAEGFIAIAPDMLSGKGPGGGGTSSFEQQAIGPAIRDLDRGDINRRLRAAGEYAMALPAAAKRVGVVGYCWGGSSSWLLAVDWADLDAAVVYYGTSPEAGYESIQAPVLGLYGGADNRVNATIPTAREAMAALGKPYEPLVFDGAGHGFLRQQPGQEGANMRATEQAWPRTIAFFREHLGR